MSKLVIVVLLAVSATAPLAAQDTQPPLSEQAIEAAKLRAQVERWSKIADRSMQTWALLSAASLAVSGIEDQHPRRSMTINLAWAGNGAVWLVSHLRERHLRGQLDTGTAPSSEHGFR